MQTLELEILNWIQFHLRCGILDAAMPAVSWICNHGEVWILLAAVLLAIPKTRKAGACLACGLAVDLLLCNLWLKPWIGRVRPFAVNPDVKLLIAPPTDASFPSGHTASSFAAVFALLTARKPAVEAVSGAGHRHCVFPAVPVCPLAHRYLGGNPCGRTGGPAGSEAGAAGDGKAGLIQSAMVGTASAGMGQV